MALVEVVLQYRPCGFGVVNEANPIPVGRTEDPSLLRAIKDRLLKEAEDQTRIWSRVDPGVAEMRAAEAERLKRVLEFLLPNKELQPEGASLRLVPQTEPEGPEDGA